MLIKVKPDWNDAFYGASLCAFKLGDYNTALEYIESGI